MIFTACVLQQFPDVLCSLCPRFYKSLVDNVWLTPEIFSPFLKIVFRKRSFISWRLFDSFTSRFSLQDVFNCRILQILNSWHLHRILTDLPSPPLWPLSSFKFDDVCRLTYPEDCWFYLGWVFPVRSSSWRCLAIMPC